MLRPINVGEIHGYTVTLEQAEVGADIFLLIDGVCPEGDRVVKTKRGWAVQLTSGDRLFEHPRPEGAARAFSKRFLKTLL